MDLKLQYNQIGENYLDGQHAFFSKREDWGRKLMLEMLPDINGKSVIDLGCGDGTDVKEYKKRGAVAITAIDPSEYMIEEAKKQIGGISNVMIGEYEHVPVDNETFDIVTGRYSMHYLDSFDKAYEEMYRVLKPGGYFVLLLPDPVGDTHMKIENDAGRQIVCVPLYGGKVTVKYPMHSFSQYFSDIFFKLFIVENFKEFIQEEVEPGFIVPTAMVMKARKK